MDSEKIARRGLEASEGLPGENCHRARGYTQALIWENANIPNTLTILRMALIGGFLTAHFYGEGRYKTAIILFVFAGITDFLDGFAARKLGQITRIGTLIDPLADKMMIISALLCLVRNDCIPVWVPYVIIIKEAYMVVGGAALYKRKVVISSDIWGKAATFLFIIAFIPAYPWHENGMVMRVGSMGVCISALLSALSAVHYTACAVKKSNGWKTD